MLFGKKYHLLLSILFLCGLICRFYSEESCFAEQIRRWLRDFCGGPGVKNPPANARHIREMRVQSLGQEDPLEEGMATHSSILIWRLPGTEETSGL